VGKDGRWERMEGKRGWRVGKNGGWETHTHRHRDRGRHRKTTKNRKTHKNRQPNTRTHTHTHTQEETKTETARGWEWPKGTGCRGGREVAVGDGVAEEKGIRVAEREEVRMGMGIGGGVGGR
jgi:hypothetical protein